MAVRKDAATILIDIGTGGIAYNVEFLIFTRQLVCPDNPLTKKTQSIHGSKGSLYNI